jgi:chemotaxis protein MotB
VLSGIRRGNRGVNVWPGYVDALASLLLVVIFVLLIFTLVQFLLRHVVSEQESELDDVHEQMATLIEQLGLERERTDSLSGEIDRLSELVAGLTDERQDLLARLAAETERALRAEKAAADRDVRIRSLDALVGQQKGELATERQLSAAAQAQVTLLSHRIEELKEQLQVIGQALQVAETEKKAQAAKIEDLGKRLNIELARRVNELQRYRSEFFGKVKDALGNNPDIKVEGDRFVFQSELLFGSGSADLGQAGKTQLAQLARTLRVLEEQIPASVDWILRVDGHTDRVPLSGSGPFASNWELSTARALSVVEYLARQGIPQRRMAAAGFGEFRPADVRSTEDANRRNRRIEIKLTTP